MFPVGEATCQTGKRYRRTQTSRSNGMGRSHEQHPRPGQRDRPERCDIRMTTLEDLWYGNINPNETILIQNRQSKHLLSLMGKSRDKLTDTFANQQKELLEKYDDAVNEMHSLIEQSAFQYGFSLGVRLVTESVSTQLTT